MKRGRPPEGEDFTIDEFRSYLREQREELRLEIPAFAAVCGVNRHSMWKILNTNLRVGERLRERISSNLKAPAELQAKYGVRSSLGWLSESHLPDYLYPTHALQRGFILHMLRLYPLARNEFVSILRSPVTAAHPLLRADAAMRLAWLYCDHDRLEDALKFADLSIEFIEAGFNTSVAEIECSIQSGSGSFPRQDAAAHALRQALHLKGKILVSQLIGNREDPVRAAAELAPLADHALEQSVMVAKYLQLPYGEDLRWKAVLIATSADQGLNEAEGFLAQSWKQYGESEMGESYVMKDRGIVYWLAGLADQARSALLDAEGRLSVLADPRALGTTFLALSNLTARQSEDDGRRFALAAAALNPYGSISANFKVWSGSGTRQKLTQDIENLLKGKGRFRSVHRVLSRVAQARQMNILNMLPASQQLVGAKSVVDLIKDNVSSISTTLRDRVNEVSGGHAGPNR